MPAPDRAIAWPVIALGAAATAAALGYSFGASRYARASEPSFIRPSEEPIVNKALDIYGHGKVSRAALRKSYDINVVYLPTMTCVGFNLLPPAAGGDDTMCFDESGSRIVLQYRDGE